MKKSYYRNNMEKTAENDTTQYFMHEGLLYAEKDGDWYSYHFADQVWTLDNTAHTKRNIDFAVPTTSSELEAHNIRLLI